MAYYITPNCSFFQNPSPSLYFDEYVIIDNKNNGGTIVEKSLSGDKTIAFIFENELLEDVDFLLTHFNAIPSPHIAIPLIRKPQEKIKVSNDNLAIPVAFALNLDKSPYSRLEDIEQWALEQLIAFITNQTNANINRKQNIPLIIIIEGKAFNNSFSFIEKSLDFSCQNISIINRTNKKIINNFIEFSHKINLIVESGNAK
jgi:hypothetical protein